MPIVAGTPGPLLGRDAEIELLALLLDGIFPKLGITSRGELRSALSARTARAEGK